MLETITTLTPLHYLYLAGVIVILSVMILRKDTPAVCLGFLFLLGLAGREEPLRCGEHQGHPVH